MFHYLTKDAYLKTHSLFLLIAVLSSQMTFAAQSKKTSNVDSTSIIKVPGQDPTNKFRISGGALHALVGYLSVNGEYLYNDKIAFGADIIYSSKKNESTDKNTNNKPYSYTYNEYNLNMSYMLTGSNYSNGFYISPKVGQLKAAIADYSDLNLSGSTSASQFVLIGGYQLAYDHKLQLKLGLGFRATQSADIVIYDNSKKEVYRTSSNLNSAAFDCNIAYTF